MSIHQAGPAGSPAGSEDQLGLPPGLLHELARALQSLRYGAIELVVHDGRVVQLERREKVRIDNEVTRLNR